MVASMQQSLSPSMSFPSQLLPDLVSHGSTLQLQTCPLQPHCWDLDTSCPLVLSLDLPFEPGNRLLSSPFPGSQNNTMSLYSFNPQECCCLPRPHFHQISCTPDSSLVLAVPLSLGCSPLLYGFVRMPPLRAISGMPVTCLIYWPLHGSLYW